MKKIYFLVIAACLLLFSACEQVPVQDSAQNNLVLKSAKKVLNFRAHLSGGQEVPAVETMATGEAIFQLSKDGSMLSYKLIVANIDSVMMSHIHLAPMGDNGGVVVWLYPSTPPPVTIAGTTNGILAQGTITADNLVGVLAGHPLSDLVDSLSIGHGYVNVHTTLNKGGEIRGQISGK
ncbi:MAG TPA: CHRD domain-containing protein [Sunxiuqinia sp.]|nr:CHRD domain-containing protein [Sunxiuqinia sp.]